MLRYLRWKPEFEEVDFLMCTIPILCLILAGLNKPLLGYFGHPTLFMVEPDDRYRFWQDFQQLANENGVVFMVSDGFLQMQYE